MISGQICFLCVPYRLISDQKPSPKGDTFIRTSCSVLSLTLFASRLPRSIHIRVWCLWHTHATACTARATMPGTSATTATTTGLFVLIQTSHCQKKHYCQNQGNYESTHEVSPLSSILLISIHQSCKMSNKI